MALWSDGAWGSVTAYKPSELFTGTQEEDNREDEDTEREREREREIEREREREKIALQTSLMLKRMTTLSRDQVLSQFW